MSTRYEDYYLWLQRKQEQYEEDEEMVDYITAMSGMEKSGLESQVRRIVVHLLKYMCQPEQRTKSWYLSVTQSYDEITSYYNGSPSLKTYISRQPVTTIYRQARSRAVAEMQVNNYVVPPSVCPWTMEQLLDEDVVLNLINEYVDHRPLY